MLFSGVDEILRLHCVGVSTNSLHIGDFIENYYTQHVKKSFLCLFVLCHCSLLRDCALDRYPLIIMSLTVQEGTLRQ
jgi:hypothetical protein